MTSAKVATDAMVDVTTAVNVAQTAAVKAVASHAPNPAPTTEAIVLNAATAMSVANATVVLNAANAQIEAIATKRHARNAWMANSPQQRAQKSTCKPREQRLNLAKPAKNAATAMIVATVPPAMASVTTTHPATRMQMQKQLQPSP